MPEEESVSGLGQTNTIPTVAMESKKLLAG
jgi:hypothetical protein